MEVLLNQIGTDILTKQNVEELMDVGFTRVQFDRRMALPAIQHFKTFLTEKTPEELKAWRFIGPGENPKDSADHGCECKLGENGTDKKHYFHYSTYLEQMVTEKRLVHTQNDYYLMSETRKLYDECTSLAFEIAASLDVLFGKVSELPIRFHQQLLNAVTKPIQNSHCKFRLVDYIVDQTSKRARAHRDKSLFSIHIFETGGVLYACADKEGTKKVPIVLKENEAAVFFGLKAQDITDGFCKALWHGSDTDPGADRSVAVYFAHANVDISDSWTYPG